MKLKLTVVLTIIGMIAGAIVWAYASFTTIPVHESDIESVEEDVSTARGAILRELDQVREDIKEIDKHWHEYNGSDPNP